MYIPLHFAEADPAEVARLIDAFPLATVVAQTGEGLVANHLPILTEGDRMIGHIARANPLHDLLADGAEVLLIFRGEDGYVSPNWYPSKAATHKAVPTWDYQVVHVTGRIRWDDSDRIKRRAVALLTRKMEGLRAGRWAMRRATIWRGCWRRSWALRSRWSAGSPNPRSARTGMQPISQRCATSSRPGACMIWRGGCVAPGRNKKRPGEPGRGWG